MRLITLYLLIVSLFYFHCGGKNQLDGMLIYLLKEQWDKKETKEENKKKEDEEEVNVNFSGINENLYNILFYKTQELSSCAILSRTASCAIPGKSLNVSYQEEDWKPISSGKIVKVEKGFRIEFSLGGLLSLGVKKVDSNLTLNLATVMGSQKKVKNFKYLVLSLSDQKTGKLTINSQTLNQLKDKVLDFSKNYTEFKADNVVRQVLQGKTPATDEQVNTFSTGLNIDIQQISNSVPILTNSFRNLVYFKNKFLFLGQKKVYSSSDAKTWPQVNTNSYPTGDDTSIVIFNDKLWIVAPYRFKDRTLVIRNEVWNSDDGVTWKQVREDGDPQGFTIREAQATVVFKDRLWIIGGSLAVGKATDVWSSKDGKVWKQETSKAGWNPRWNLNVVVFQNKLWIVGGRTYTPTQNGGFSSSSVWSSSDGIKWEKVGNLPTGLEEHEVLSFNDKLWTIGGVDEKNQSRKGEILVSFDGKDWERAGSLNITEGYKSLFTSTVMNNSIYFVNFGKAWKISIK